MRPITRARRVCLVPLVLLPLTTAGCSLPDDGDVSACIMVANAHNTAETAVRAWEADGRPREGRSYDLARGSFEDRRVVVSDALRTAGDVELTALLTEAAQLLRLDTDEVGEAFSDYAVDIFDRCNELGIHIERVR